MSHTIKNKQIRVLDKLTGEMYYFRGKRKDDAIKSLVADRFEAVYLTGDDLFQDIQSGLVKQVIYLSETQITPPETPLQSGSAQESSEE